MRDTINRYGSKHVSRSLFDATFFVHILIHSTRELQVIYCRSTYQMTVLLSEMSIFCVVAKFEVQLASYASKHASQDLSSKPSVCT